MSAAADDRSKSPSIPLDAAAASSAMDDDAPEFATTPAADLIASGVGGLALALGLCPEAAQSAKRTKMIHKKGEVAVAGTALVLKWNVDYKAGNVVNVRVVTLKQAGGAEEDATGSATEGEAAPAAAAAGGVAGVKRRRDPKPEKIDVKRHLALAIEGLKFQGREADTDYLVKLAEGL